MIDSHGHINTQDVQNINTEVDKINRLKYLKAFVNVGLDYKTSGETIELSTQNNKFYSVIGVHPLYEGNIQSIYDLYQQQDNTKVVGIGETGIDSMKDEKEQIYKFIASIELANTLHLPLIIHANNTNELVIKTLHENRPLYGFVFHCFQPNIEVLNQIMQMEGHISLGTPITRKTAKKSLEVIQKVDIYHLMIELDYPYMSQNAVLDGKNVFDRIKTERHMEKEELEQILDDNTKRFFKKMKL